VPLPPWGAIQALWNAIPFETSRRAPNAITLERGIASLRKEVDEAVTCQEFERAAAVRDRAMRLKRDHEGILKKLPSPLPLSIESVRKAIERGGVQAPPA